jgi:Ca2+-dependent lipid-binding protein
LGESLVFNLWDYNDHRKNTRLGAATFDMAVLQDDASQEGILSPILLDGKERGELKYDITFYPVLKPEEGQEHPPETSKQLQIGL